MDPGVADRIAALKESIPKGTLDGLVAQATTQRVADVLTMAAGLLVALTIGSLFRGMWDGRPAAVENPRVATDNVAGDGVLPLSTVLALAGISCVWRSSSICRRFSTRRKKRYARSRLSA